MSPRPCPTPSLRPGTATSNPSAAVEAHGLGKTYGGLLGSPGTHALRGVDLSVPRSTAFGLLGPNGAGKTTFIKIALSVVRPTRGGVTVLGGDPDDPAIRRQIGYLPERLTLPAAWTPTQFLDSVARLKRVPRRKIHDDVRRQLGRVGMMSESHRRLGGFSKGMRQRVGLAAALLGEPELLVLDEPTDGVDPIGRTEIRRLLGEERERGATIFLNSHLLAETERVCDRIAILKDGAVVREGPLSELAEEGHAGWLARFEGEGDWQRLRAVDVPGLDEELAGLRASGRRLVELRRPLSRHSSCDGSGAAA